MTTTYVLTIRPAWVEHVPAGWKELVAADDPRPGYYGHVTYDEPLDFKVADHFNLRPCGPTVVEVHADDDVLALRDVAGGWHVEMEYQLACGLTTPEAVELSVRERCAEYDVPFESVVFGHFDPRPARDIDGVQIPPTASGKVLTEADMVALVAEVEAGYDVEGGMR